MAAALLLCLAPASCERQPDVEVRGLARSLARSAALPPELADTPALTPVVWLLALLNERGGVASEAEIAERFHPRFLAQFPASVTAERLRSTAGAFAPVMLRTLGRTEHGLLALYGESAVGSVRLLLNVDDGGSILYLLLQPYVSRSLEEIPAAVVSLGERTHFLASEIRGDSCVPIAASTPEVVLSIASTSKLYILLALVDAILAGETTWEAPLAIREAWKSRVPERGSSPGAISGKTPGLGAQPAGTVLSMREVAGALIASSDNTANDHFVHTLGRARVEAAVRDSGHHDPGRNTPYLTTTEFFALRVLAGEEVDRYLALDAEARRTYLERILPTRRAPPDEPLERHIEKIGIFAGADDLCRLMATLLARAHAHAEAAPLLDILARDGQHLGLSPRSWPYVGGKGGSFRGVLSRVKLLRRDDDRWFVVVTGINNDDWVFRDVDTHALAGVESRVIDLLADFDR